MTVKELKERLNDFDENLEIGLQFQDGGGEYCGDTFTDGDSIWEISIKKDYYGNNYLLLR